jgi:hypothetical protein
MGTSFIRSCLDCSRNHMLALYITYNIYVYPCGCVRPELRSRLASCTSATTPRIRTTLPGTISARPSMTVWPSKTHTSRMCLAGRYLASESRCTVSFDFLSNAYPEYVCSVIWGVAYLLCDVVCVCVCVFVCVCVRAQIGTPQKESNRRYSSRRNK